jgi:hypothetical protein
MAMQIPLPSDWENCPKWWQNLVNDIEAEANTRGIYTHYHTWSEFLCEKLREKGLIYENGVGCAVFEREEDFLAIKIRYGI